MLKIARIIKSPCKTAEHEFSPWRCHLQRATWGWAQLYGPQVKVLNAVQRERPGKVLGSGGMTLFFTTFFNMQNTTKKKNLSYALLQAVSSGTLSRYTALNWAADTKDDSPQPGPGCRRSPRTRLAVFLWYLPRSLPSPSLPQGFAQPAFIFRSGFPPPRRLGWFQNLKIHFGVGVLLPFFS